MDDDSPLNGKDKQQQFNSPVEEYVEFPSISDGKLLSQMLTSQDTVVMDTTYDSMYEIEENPCANESNDKRKGEASLFIESYTHQLHFIQRLTPVALPTIRFPSKLGLIDNLPDWNVSRSATYNLNWYMSSNLDHVKVRFVPSESSQIAFDPETAQLRFAGSSNRDYQSIICIDVACGSNAETAILIVYTCPDQAVIRDNIELGKSAGEDEHDHVPSLSPIVNNDTPLIEQKTGVGIDLGRVYVCEHPVFCGPLFLLG
jgi:hypothetical protein